MGELCRFWWDVVRASVNHARTVWPIESVILAILVTIVTIAVFRWRGEWPEVKKLTIGFLVSIIVTFFFFVAFLVIWGPFIYSENIRAQVAEAEQLRREKTILQKELVEVKDQRDFALNCVP